MEGSFNVPDSSDWLETPLSQLAPVEQALRCQVCKDFFNTPMITSCSHTFCSLCIRRCLTNDGRCPTCRSNDQEMKLRSNSILQELVDAFQTARPVVLHLGHGIKASTDVGRPGVKKRKFEGTDVEGIEDLKESNGGRKKSRSQLQDYPSTQEVSMDEGEDQEDSDIQPDDGLAACPICGARMREEAVYSHLDIHNEPDLASQAQLESARILPSSNMAPRSRQLVKAMERLPQLNYSLLKDTALRKKLSELGIPTGGSRALLIRRHTEWINLVNANCDSRRPRTKRELLHELDVWDKTQGRQVSTGSYGGGGSSSVMDKDFDGAAWATSHDSDFQNLIARARRKAKPKIEDTRGTGQADAPSSDNRSGNGPLPEQDIVVHEDGSHLDCLPHARETNEVSSPDQPMGLPFIDLEKEG